MAVKKAAFPKYLFITADSFSDGSGNFFQAHEDQITAARNDDSITNEVATYQLVKVHALEVEEVLKGIAGDVPRRKKKK
jgi:hypothetical protein